MQVIITCAMFADGQRIHMLFDSSWKFYRGDIARGEDVTVDDKSWRIVQLPHDWSIEDLPGQSDSVIGPFSSKSIGGTATGYTLGGVSWYRKHFRLNKILGNRVLLGFDGVYMNSDVWINGHHLGNHPYGYSPFTYDLTQFIKDGQENIVAVRVSNEGKNSRWYSGSGIYRHVWLTISNPIHVNDGGIYITTPIVSPESATIFVENIITIEQPALVSLKVRTRILDSKGKIVTSAIEPVSSPDAVARSFSTAKCVTRLRVRHPSLWSPQSPNLYSVVTDVIHGENIVDHVVTPFGIRSLVVNAENGLLINGKNVQLRGGCMHHDNGPLGAAAIDRAEERRVELLKAFGFNAVRTSHNPPSQQFLDACDRLGILVIDEAFDQWRREKNPQDYHLYFDSSWRRDIDAMVLRDRNHPCVIFWSIGNEINERADASGLSTATLMIDEVKRLDSSRPITEAICDFWDHPGYRWDTTASAFALLDVGGYNYQWRHYEPDHEIFPHRIMMGTESVPSEAFDNWKLVEAHPYVIGDFVWTAMDYLGETGIGHTTLDSTPSYDLQKFPWFNAWCGDIDLTGGKKPQSYYRDIVWRQKGITMLVHQPIPPGHREAVSYWGWPDELASYTFRGQENRPLYVNVYTRYPSVRLELNGKILEEKNVSPDDLTARFEIKYEPGELKAIAINDGRQVDSFSLRTAGFAKQIRLSADRRKIKFDPNDLAFITVEVVDGQGELVDDSAIPLQFEIRGDGEIIATASANPSGMESFQKPVHKMFRGKALVVVRPKAKRGSMVIEATGEGLAPGKIEINSY